MTEMKTMLPDVEVAKKEYVKYQIAKENAYKIYRKTKATQIVLGSNDVIDRMVTQAYNNWDQLSTEFRYWDAVLELHDVEEF